MLHSSYHYALSPVSAPQLIKSATTHFCVKSKLMGIPSHNITTHTLRDPKRVDDCDGFQTDLQACILQTLAPLPLALNGEPSRGLGKPRPAPRERNPPLGGDGTNPLDLPIPLPPPAPPLPSPLALPLPRRPRKGGDISDTVLVSSSMAFDSASITLSIS